MRSPSSTSLVLLLLGWLAAAPVAAVTISLQEAMVVDAPVATVADVARLSDAEEGVAAAVGAIELQRLAGLGTYRIEAAEVVGAIRRLHPDLAIRVEGTCTVRRATVAFDAERLLAAARAELTTRAGDRDLEITVDRSPRAAVLPSSPDEPYRIVAEPLTRSLWGQVPYRVRVLSGEEEVHRSLVVLDVTVFAAVVVARRSLPRGHRLALQDLRTDRLPLDRRVGADPPAMADLVGRDLLVSVDAGEPVRLGTTRAPLAVRAGSQITIVYQDPRFTVTGVGEAISSGAVADIVRLRQPNGRVIQGEVQADGSVVVNY